MWKSYKKSRQGEVLIYEINVSRFYGETSLIFKSFSTFSMYIWLQEWILTTSSYIRGRLSQPVSLWVIDALFFSLLSWNRGCGWLVGRGSADACIDICVLSHILFLFWADSWMRTEWTSQSVIWNCHTVLISSTTPEKGSALFWELSYLW